MIHETHSPVHIRGPLLSGEFQIADEAPAPFTSFAPWVQDLIRQHLESYEWEDGDRILVETRTYRRLFTMAHYDSRWRYESDGPSAGEPATPPLRGERIIDVFRFPDEGQEQTTHDWQVGDIIPAYTQVGRPWLGRELYHQRLWLFNRSGAFSGVDREILWIDDRS